MSRYVIIGNSAAAIGAIEGIRQIDKTGKITVISNERYHTYSRPLISYLLLGKTDRQKMKFRPDSFYSDNGCEVLLGETAVAIDRAELQVRLQSGKTVDYEKLLIATGSSPFVPPMKGMQTVKNRYGFSSLDDALELENALFPDAGVLVLGAGLIGLKCAEGIHKRVRNITVIDLAPKVLSSILDQEASTMVKGYLEGKGLNFVLSDSVSEFDSNRARLQSGSMLDFDILVTAVGVRPNIRLVEDIGGSCGAGIIINDRCETSLENIYAAGDCTQSIDTVTQQMKVMALLPNAYMQGECAGINMAHGSAVFDRAMLMNSMGLLGLHIMTAGIYDGEAYTSREGQNYKKLFYKENRLVGFILIGDVTGAGIYTSLIREKTPLDMIDFKLVCLKPSLMAFSGEDRKLKLGGEQ